MNSEFCRLILTDRLRSRPERFVGLQEQIRVPIYKVALCDLFKRHLHAAVSALALQQICGVVHQSSDADLDLLTVRRLAVDAMDILNMRQRIPQPIDLPEKILQIGRIRCLRLFFFICKQILDRRPALIEDQLCNHLLISCDLKDLSVGLTAKEQSRSVVLKKSCKQHDRIDGHEIPKYFQIDRIPA